MVIDRCRNRNIIDDVAFRPARWLQGRTQPHTVAPLAGRGAGRAIAKDRSDDPE
jgi:hypothetical protein